MTDELSQFASVVGLDRAAPSRYSALLLLHLYGGQKSGTVDPRRVVHEINALEGIGPVSQLKAPIQNKYPPLKGLWHKHYQQDGLRALALNLGKALKRYGLPYAQRKVDEGRLTGKLEYFSKGDVMPLVRDALHNNFVQLGKDAGVSGEWLLFATYNDKNYYLCLTTHDKSQHFHLRRTIDEICCREFPFLPGLLAEA